MRCKNNKRKRLGFNGKVRIELESEIVTNVKAARILISEGDKLAAEIIAKTEQALGTDYGLYDYVSLHLAQAEIKD